MEPKFHELLRIFSTFGYFKGHPIQKKVFGNSDNWKIGKLDIWIFGKSESRKLDNPSLARAVASLARTGNTSKYLGAFFRMGILKKFRLTDMSYFSSRHGVPGVPASLYWRMGGMGWDGMGWSPNLFFWPISRKLLDIFFKLFRILLEHVSRYFFRKTQKN